MSNELGIKAVIFDIDGTLTTRVSWNYLVEFLGGSAEQEKKNHLDYKKGVITYAESDAALMKLWVRTGRGYRSEFRKAFQTIPLRPGALDLVEYLKGKGIIVCLITGSMDLYAETIANRLGIQFYFANAKLNWGTEDEILGFECDINEAGKKLEQFQEFCVQQGLSAADCVVVGDSDNDYELFRTTKRGIAIRSEFEDIELENMAWKVIRNLPEIKNIIK